MTTKKTTRQRDKHGRFIKQKNKDNVAVNSEPLTETIDGKDCIVPDNTGRKQVSSWFKPGQSGNPKGRPKGSRNAVSEAFLKDLHAVWHEATSDGSTRGIEAIRSVFKNQPEKALSCMVQVLPKDFQVTVTDRDAQWVINASELPLDSTTWLEGERERGVLIEHDPDKGGQGGG